MSVKKFSIKYKIIILLSIISFLPIFVIFGFNILYFSNRTLSSEGLEKECEKIISGFEEFAEDYYLEWYGYIWKQLEEKTKEVSDLKEDLLLSDEYTFYRLIVFNIYNETDIQPVSDNRYQITDVKSDGRIVTKYYTENKYNFRIRVISDNGEMVFDSNLLELFGDFETEIYSDFFKNAEDFLYDDEVMKVQSESEVSQILKSMTSASGTSYQKLYTFKHFNITDEFSGYLLLSNIYDETFSPKYFIEYFIDKDFIDGKQIIISIIISIILILNIVFPIIKLSKQTKEVIDKKGRVIKTELYASKRKDEIGDLSRSFSSLIQRLNDRIHFVEAFSSDVVHEFKNPLAAIRSSVDVMNDPDLNEEDRKELYKSINDEIHHLEVLLNEMRNISKIENLESDEGKENIPLGLFADNIIKRVKQSYPEVDFKVNFDSVYFARPDYIDRMLENLIDNAASFAMKSELKKVIVSFVQNKSERKKVSYIAIVVEDSGPGVQKGEEGKIFNRFYSHRDDVQKLKHSGLGLSIVKAIAESMNGKINVSKSENLGGAMFVVVLPLSGNLDEITNL